MRWLYLLFISFTLSFSPVTNVYVCVSGTAYAYHRTLECSGLENCTHTIREVSMTEAVKEYKRKPCRRCYK
jgi:hypothetical protein